MSYFRLGAAAGCLILLIGGYWAGHGAGENKTQAKWNEAKAGHAEALALQESEYRAKERKWNEGNIRLLASLNAAQEKNRNELETALAAARDGTVRLRGDLAGCRDRLPGIAAPGPGDDEAGGGGLSGARQEVALRIGADADNVVANLTACQAYVRAIQPDST